MTCLKTFFLIVVTALPASAADTEADLIEAFSKCRSSLTNLRTLNEADRAAVTSLRTRFDRAQGEGSMSTKSAAARLQLSLWIEDVRSSEGQERISSDWKSLLESAPENGALASGFISWQAASGILVGQDLLAARRDLLNRFPGSTETALEVAAGLRREIDCAGAIEVLRGLGDDAPSKAKVLMAQAYFDENMFDEAATTLAQLNLEAIEDVAVRAQANNIVRQCEEIKSLWEAELAIRAIESEADNLPRVTIKTAKGSILIELFEDDAPNTVANFISLVRTDYYDGIAFHRFEPNFMIQGGCPNTKSGEGTYGTGGPGYTIADECSGDNARLHFADSVAMAKTSAPNTGGSQFYLNHRPTTWLNNRHTVFGRVLEGREVACKLRKDDLIEDIEIIRIREGSTYVPQVTADVISKIMEDESKSESNNQDGEAQSEEKSSEAISP